MLLHVHADFAAWILAVVIKPGACIKLHQPDMHAHLNVMKQGDELVVGLAESKLLQSDSLGTLRLAQCGISCEGACRLARALEAVGEPRMPCVRALLIQTDIGAQHFRRGNLQGQPLISIQLFPFIDTSILFEKRHTQQCLPN